MLLSTRSTPPVLGRCWGGIDGGIGAGDDREVADDDREVAGA